MTYPISDGAIPSEIMQFIGGFVHQLSILDVIRLAETW